MKHYNTGKVDTMISAIDQMLLTSDNTIDYPTTTPVPQDDIDPNWFKESYKGSGNNSEFGAIQLYLADIEIGDQLQDLFAGIAVTEMHHYDKLQGLIKALGGDLLIDYSNSGLNKDITDSSNYRKALEIGIKNEIATNDLYKETLIKLDSAKDSVTKKYCIDLINKLIADEIVHIKLFQEALDNLPKETSQEAALRHLSKHL